MFEFVPFFAGALVGSWRRPSPRMLALISIVIGTAVAAAAGELAAPTPVPALALAVDSLAAAAGCIAARLLWRARASGKHS